MRVAGQHTQYGLKLGIETVERSDARQKLFSDFIAKRIRNDHADLLAAATILTDLVPVELHLLRHTRDGPCRGLVDLFLPSVVQLNEVIVDVEVFDPFEERAQQGRHFTLFKVVDEPAIVLI